MKQIRRSREVEKDIDGIVVYYSRQNLPLANRFIREYEASLRAIQKMPGIGSSRIGHELSISELRAYSMNDFPYFVFYREHKDAIDIDRVLHTHRDIFSIFL